MQVHMPLFVIYAGFLSHNNIEHHHQDEADGKTDGVVIYQRYSAYNMRRRVW